MEEYMVLLANLSTSTTTPAESISCTLWRITSPVDETTRMAPVRFPNCFVRAALSPS